MSGKIVYLMRGLSSSGKSWTARRLAGETGLILETDEYFYMQLGDNPSQYDWHADLLPAAQRWNFERFVTAVAEQVSLIVVDRGNSWNEETRKYAQLAVDCGYHVELKEPESPWWQEIRVLLKYKDTTQLILYQWADRLTEIIAEKSTCLRRALIEPSRRKRAADPVPAPLMPLSVDSSPK